MKVDWIVNADACQARIYSVPSGKYKHELSLIHELNHPECKAKRQDLKTDKPGHYRSKGGGAAGQFADKTDSKAEELDKFARKIAGLIDQSRAVEAFEKLIIVAGPHFYGLIAMHLSEHSKKLIKPIRHKDRMHGTVKELHAFIQSELLPT